MAMQTESVGERDQTEETLRRQNEELAALHETTLGLIQQLDLDTLLHSIVSRATALAGTPHGYLYIVEPGEQTMAVRVGTGIFSEQIGYRLRRGEGLSGRVWETGQPLVVDDYQTWLGRRRDFDPMRLRAVVGIPLFASGGGQVTGDSSARGSEAHPTPNTHHP